MLLSEIWKVNFFLLNKVSSCFELNANFMKVNSFANFVEISFINTAFRLDSNLIPYFKNFIDK